MLSEKKRLFYNVWMGRMMRAAALSVGKPAT